MKKSKKVVSNKNKKSEVRMKRTSKKVTKKASSKQGRRPAPKNAPDFDPKKYIKMSDLAEKMGIAYQSLHVKQQRLQIWAVATRNPETGSVIIAFTNADAKKLMEKSARKATDSRVFIKDLEKTLNVSRPKLLSTLKKLNIQPSKRRDEDGNRASLTIAESAVKKVRKHLHD
jgi:murein tripeptide amidase MpaA